MSKIIDKGNKVTIYKNTASELASRFWTEVVATANYIRNRCPTRTLQGKTPHEVWTGQPPNVSHIQEFSTRVDPSPGKGKLDPRSMEGVLVGFSEESKAYRIWLLEGSKLVISRDIRFSEKPIQTARAPSDFGLEDEDSKVVEGKGTDSHEFVDENLSNSCVDRVGQRNERGELSDGIFSLRDSSANWSEEDCQTAPDVPANATEVAILRGEMPTLRRGRGRPRLIYTGSRGRPRTVFHKANTCATPWKKSSYLSEVPMREALAGPDSPEWEDAIIDEARSLLKRVTWKLVDRPKNKAVIGCCMFLRNKVGADNQIEHRKARLVAQGFSEQPGVHFNQTFAPVARLSSIQLIAALAVRFDLKIWQLEVTTA